MRTISEFIQEQNSDVMPETTDSLVGAYCECAAAASLVNYYAEMGQLVAFASENDVNLFGIIQEEAEEGKKNIFQKIGGGIKGLWEKFINFIKGIIDHIKDFFGGKKLEAAEKKLSEVDPNTEITIDQRVLFPYVIIAMCQETVRELDKSRTESGSGSSGGSDEFSTTIVQALQPINAKFDELSKGGANLKSLIGQYGHKIDGFDWERRNDGRITITVGAFKTILADVRSSKMKNEQDRIKIRLDEIKKYIDNGVKSARAEVEDDPKYKYTSKWDGGEGSEKKKEMDKQLGNLSKKADLAGNAITKCMNHITKLFDGMMATYNKIAEDVQSMLKKNTDATGVKNEIGRPKDVKESFYFV